MNLVGGSIVHASDTTAQFNGGLNITAGDLTVNAGKSAQGTSLEVAAVEGVKNEGTVDFDTIRVTTGSITGQAGTLGAADSVMTIEATGTIDQATVNGAQLTNAGTVTTGALSLGTGSNTGTITADATTITGDAFENTTGTMNLGNSLAGSINNAGKINVTGGTADPFEFTAGTIDNTGTFTADKGVTIAGGTFSQNSETEATFADVTVNAGQFNTAAGTTSKGNALTIVMTAGADAVGSVNDGMLDFSTIKVTAGKITGSGTLGTAGSTIDVAAAGSVTQAQVNANAFTNAGFVAGNVAIDHGSNAGTIEAGDLTVAGAEDVFTNTGAITTTGSAALAGVNNQNAITLGAGGTFTGENTNAGTVTVNADKAIIASGTTTTSATGGFTANAGLDVNEGAHFTVSGADATASVAGGLLVEGTVTTSGTTTIDKIAAESSGTIVAAGGSLSIGDLTETDGMTFTQTADTNYVLSKGWFENSTINIEGGHFDASVIHDDEGNASGMLGHNTVNIGKSELDPVVGPDSELPSAEKVDWARDYVTVKVDTVTSDTTIHVLEGGVLDVDAITLTPESGAGQTITIGTGGGLQTSLDQFFEKVATTVTKVDAVDPETGKVDIVTDVVATTTVTDVKDSIKNGLVFEDGSMVAWDDEDWSVDLVASTSNSLANAGLISEDVRVQQHFLGDFMGDFTVDTAARLEQEQEKLDQSFVLDPGVIFDTTTLHNVTTAVQDANRGLVIGGTADAGENQINYTTGFKNVANADYVDVEGGREFVLVGEVRPESFDWRTGYDDDNRLLTDAADGGTINVNDGTFTMGSAGLVESTVGWVENVNVAADGALVTKNGEFAAWTVDNAEGRVDVTAGSILHTNTVTNTGAVHVAGSLTNDAFNNDHGTLEVAEGGQAQIGELTSSTMDAIVANAGTLVVETVAGNILAGELTNAATGQLTVSDDIAMSGNLTNAGDARWQNVTIDLGVWENSGYEQGADLVVNDGAVHSNSGTSIWNNVTIEEGAQASNTAASDGEGFKVGSAAADEAFNVNGTYTNSGRLDASEAELTTVAGQLNNTLEGVAGYQDMTVAMGGTSTNAGYEQGHKLTVEFGATHVNTGTSIWDEVEIQIGGTAVMGSEAEDESFGISGIYENSGIVDAAQAETVTVTGAFTNTESAEADWNTLVIAGTKDDEGTVHEAIVSNAGTEKGEHLTIAAGGTHVVTGESLWSTVSVEAGGTDRFGSDASDETFTIAGEYVNNGTLQASEAEQMILAGSLTNNGNAFYQDLTVDIGAESVNTGYEKGDNLFVAVEGSHVNTGTSIWNTATVEAGGSMVNGADLGDGPKGDEEGFASEVVMVTGSDAGDESFNVEGGFVNHGKLDATKTEITNVTGEITNDGQAWYDDMDVFEGAVSNNAGYEQGDILTVEGTHANTGTSIWNQVAVTGSAVNGAELSADAPKGDEEGFASEAVAVVGSDAVDETLAIDGSYANHGILEASKAENTNVAGSLVNDGQAFYDDMTLTGEGASSVNDGLEKGDILTVGAGTTHENTGTSIWNGVKVAGTGTNGADLGDGPKGNEEGFAAESYVQIGTAENTGDLFEISGEYHNHGQINAAEAENTNVAGLLTNDGQAFYDDMTIANGGASANDGFEKGDILTVEGSHTNTGTSIWNGLTVAEGGIASNGDPIPEGGLLGHEEGFASDAILVVGSDDADVDDGFDIKGTFTNNGILDATGVEETIVVGELTNNGQAGYENMTVAAGGVSDNNGFEQGNILTVEDGATHDNSGVSIWNNVKVTGSAVNDGDAAIGGEGGGDEFVVEGGYTNNGNLDATDAENTVVAGDLDNNGHAEYDDMDINAGGTSTNDDYEKGDILDVNEDGTWNQNGESHWNNVNIAEGGSGSNTGELTVEDDLVIAGGFDNSGDVTADEVIVEEGGVLDIGDGSINAGKTTVNGGDIIVGNDKPIAEENRVDYDTTIAGPVNGNWWVIGNGDLGLGEGADKFADEIGAPDIPETGSRLTVTQNVTIGESGSIAVGSDVWTDKDNHQDVGEGNLFFASDSLTVIDAGILENGAAGFTGTKDGATVTVEPGAELVLGGLELAGDYVITSGFETAGNTSDSAWTGGWTGDALWAPTDPSTGLNWELELNWDETKVWVTATLEDVLTKYPDISIPGNINDSLENCRNAGGADQVLACTVMRNPNLSDQDKQRIINSVAEIGHAAGAMAMAFNEAAQAADSIEGRLSMKAEAFDRDGAMKGGDRGTGLWVDALGTWTNADSYGASGHVTTGYDAESYGFIMGLDHKLDGRDAILGGAFSYTKGSLTSTGDLLETENSFSTWGLHLYGAVKPTDGTNLVATLSYMRSSSEASQRLPAASGFGAAAADIDTNMFAAGLRGEVLWNLGGMQIVPHAGVRMVVAKTEGYDTRLDGQKAYGNDADVTTTFQVPVGVAVRCDVATDGGWTVRPALDLTFVPQFGDTEQDIDVKGTSGAVDTVTGEFTGDFATQVSFGLQVESETNTTFGLRYGLTAGDEGRRDHSVKLEFRKLF